jgi:hypothetical protein
LGLEQGGERGFAGHRDAARGGIAGVIGGIVAGSRGD